MKLRSLTLALRSNFAQIDISTFATAATDVDVLGTGSTSEGNVRVASVATLVLVALSIFTAARTAASTPRVLLQSDGKSSVFNRGSITVATAISRRRLSVSNDWSTSSFSVVSDHSRRFVLKKKHLVK